MCIFFLNIRMCLQCSGVSDEMGMEGLWRTVEGLVRSTISPSSNYLGLEAKAKVKEKMHKAPAASELGGGVKAKVGSVPKSPTEATTDASAVTLLFHLIHPSRPPTSQSAFLPRDAEAGSGTQRRLLFRELPEVKRKWSSSRQLLVPCFIGGWREPYLMLGDQVGA